MPLQKIVLKPGLNREITSLASEGGWFECDKVRFRSGFPENIGGWTNISTGGYTFKGVAREMQNWITLAYYNLNGVGTNQKFYIENGGQYNDITPLINPSGTTLANNPITTVSGERLVTIAQTSHGMTPGTYATFSGASTFNNVTISGEYEIITTPDGNSYTVLSATAANASSAGGGASVLVYNQIPAGNSVYTIGNGWGAGTWGGVVVGGVNTGWGSASIVGVGQQLRLWSADNFGQDLIFAPRGGAIYYWTVDTSAYTRAVTLQSLGGAFVPNTTLMILSSDVQRFVIALGANSYDPTNSNTAFEPLLVRWSDQESSTNWIPASTNQSGEYKLTSGSTIVTGRVARQEILIWTDAALFSMQYLGPPFIWGFNLLMDNLSIISPGAAAAANNVSYWMGVDKFYKYSGRVDTLPCTLRSYVFDNLNYSQAYQIVSGTNEAYSEVWWFYPSAASQVNDSYVIYNYLEDIWYYGSMRRTAWLDSPLRSYPMAGFSVQTSYLSANISASVTSITLLNGASYPDDGTVTIGSEQISYTGIDGNTLTGLVRGVNSTTAATHSKYDAVTYLVPNQILYHENGVDDFSLPTPVAINAFIGSSDFDIGDGNNFGFVWRMLPDVSFNGSNVQTPEVTITLRPRQNSGTPYTSANAPTVASGNNYTPVNNANRTYTVQLFTGQVYTRVRGRQMSFKIESNSLGVHWVSGAHRLDYRQDGRK